MKNRCCRRGTALVVGVALGLVGGCETTPKLKPDGMGRAHTPQAIDAYAAKNGVSREQARQELSQMADAADAEKAVADLQEAGMQIR